ncbi:ABC transporter substrate-binding protein [Cuniculiplasma sp. SKW3]|uniref:ABC transporter substrate-binding protein n=1 Tax=unclassified Cuniculiplasma TaxID=2619706 RepID=UPI003FD3C5C5
MALKDKKKIILAVTAAMLMIFSSMFVIAVSAYGNNSGGGIFATPQTSNSTANSTLYLSPGPTPAFTDNFNPFNIWSTPAGIMGFIYEPLFQINTYNGTVIPWLATSYHFLNGGRNLTVDLRHNVTFSNGEPFNASSVVFTFNTEKKDYGEWGTVSNISAINNYEVEFNFTQPQTQYLFYIGSTVIIPQNVWQGVKNPASQTVTNPIGTGPYMIQSFSPQKIVLVKNPHYWQPNEPKIDHVVYVDYTSNSALSLALAEGKVEWASVFEPNVTQLFVANNPAHNHYWYPPGQPVTLLLNNLIYPLNLSYFRQAISLAINRTAIMNIGEYGYETPANAANILQQQMSYLNATNTKMANQLAQYNPSAALQLLESHGFTLKSGTLYSPNGQPVPNLNLMSIAGYSDWDTDITIIAADLKQIGISVTTTTPTQSVVSGDVTDGNYTMALDVDTGIGPNPWYDYSGIQGPVVPIGQNAYINPERWNVSSQFEQYFNNFPSAVTNATQEADINGMASIMLQQMPIVPLVYSADWYEYVNTTIGGWPNAAHPYWIPMPWYPGPSEVVLLHLYVKSNAPNSTGISNTDYYIIAAVVVVVIAAVASFGWVRSKKMKAKE